MNAPLPLPALDEIRAHEAEMIDIRHQIHANPELAYEEHATAELVADAITVNNPQGNNPQKSLPVGEAERWISAFRWTRFCAG